MLSGSQTANSLSSVSKISNYVKKAVLHCAFFLPNRKSQQIQGHFFSEVEFFLNNETCFGYLKLNSGQGCLVF